jgi:hypothetical protein
VGHLGPTLNLLPNSLPCANHERIAPLVDATPNRERQFLCDTAKGARVNVNRHFLRTERGIVHPNLDPVPPAHCLGDLCQRDIAEAEEP